MTTSLVTNDAVEFYPPPISPAPNGLLGVVDWYHGENTDEGEDGPDRFLIGGIHIRNWNYGPQSSTGVWDQPWCEAPTFSTTPGISGTRPTMPADYLPTTAWAYDLCDLTEYSKAEIKRNAQQWLRLMAPIDVETAFAARLLSDAGSLPMAVDFTTALGQLEGALAQTGTLGVIHASASLASAAARSSNLVRDEKDGKLKTRLGHTWAFGGGYVSTLENTLVATSALYGWKDEPKLLTTIEQQYNQFVAVAQQSFAIGYEAFVGAAVYAPS